MGRRAVVLRPVLRISIVQVLEFLLPQELMSEPRFRGGYWVCTRCRTRGEGRRSDLQGSCSTQNLGGVLLI